MRTSWTGTISETTGPGTRDRGPGTGEPSFRHCEERSDEAISIDGDCHGASPLATGGIATAPPGLAMTNRTPHPHPLPQGGEGNMD